MRHYNVESLQMMSHLVDFNKLSASEVLRSGPRALHEATFCTGFCWYPECTCMTSVFFLYFVHSDITTFNKPEANCNRYV
jgi:hypothetical protein